MKCIKAQKFISDYIDNLLEAGQVQRLERHLEKCAGCRDFLSDMESIVHNAKELDTLNPSDDLWPFIERELLKKNRHDHAQQKKSSWSFPLYAKGPAFALSTLLAIIVLVPLIYYGLPHMRNTNNDPGKSTVLNYQIAEQHYQSAIKALDQVIEVQESKLSPELLAVFKKNLAIIDDSIRICKESMEKSPETRETNKLLLICYRKKIELLTEIRDITMQT